MSAMREFEIFIEIFMVKEFIEEFVHARRKIFLLLSILAGLFLFGTVAFSLIKLINPIDAFILTAETLAFQHTEDTGVGRVFQMSLLLFGVVFLWFCIWTSMDILLEGNFHKHFREVRTMERLKNLKNHYIICGGGRVGAHVAELLIIKKIPFVLIEKDIHSVSLLKRKFELVWQGDSVEEETLKEVSIDKAKGLVAVLPETEKNIMIILTAKELNPNIKIYARSHREEFVKKLKKAGANYVILPEISGAEDIMKKVDKEEEVGGSK